MTDNYMKFTYSALIPLQLQVWLATNTYKSSSNPKAISATSFLKSTKSLILSTRADNLISEAIASGDFSALHALNKPDLLGFMSSRIGTAIHDATERAWLKNYKQALRDLGYTETYIERIVINPEPSEKLKDDAIVVYTEKRLEREIEGYTITGELDFAFNGVIQDLKTTKAYSYKFADDDKHTMQMSIYKWIFEGHGIHFKDVGQINYLFTDWAAYKASDSDYPPMPVLGVEVTLNNTQVTENFLRNKIQMIEEHMDSPEELLPQCTPAEVWQSESTWAYYANPANVGGRATKVFSVYEEAVAHQNSKGTGTIVERVGQVSFCKFCAGASLCKQKDVYIQSGLLEYP